MADGVISDSDIRALAAMNKRNASGSKISAANKRKIQVLEMLDEETLGRLLQEYGGGQVGFDPHMAELQTTGGDVARAAFDFQNAVDQGYEFSKVKEEFDKKVGEGFYNLSDEDITLLDSKLMQSSLLNQKSSANSSAAKMQLFKSLGVPEMALIDSAPNQTAASKARNPFDMPSSDGDKYQTQLDELVKQQTELQKSKPKNKGLKGAADGALTALGGLLGGVYGGLAGSAVAGPIGTVGGAALGGFSGAAWGSNIIGEDTEGRKKQLAELTSKQANTKALMGASDARQKAKADLYQQVYTKALGTKKQSTMSPYDQGRQNLMNVLAGR